MGPIFYTYRLDSLGDWGIHRGRQNVRGGGGGQGKSVFMPGGPSA